MRFNQVFVFLLALSFLSSFVFPHAPSDRARAQIQNLFLPVAWPVRKVAAAVHHRMVGDQARDDGSPNAPRSPAALIEENTRLRATIGNLQAQLDQLQARENERNKLGQIGKFCAIFPVTGADPSSSRDALLLGGTSFGGLSDGQPVLCSTGLVGRISRAGAAGAQVLLVTDRQSKFTGRFVRAELGPDGSFHTREILPDNRLVEGMGSGQMIVRHVSISLIKSSGLRVGDWIVLSRDSDWPAALDRYRVGTITHIDNEKSAGFAAVYCAPDQKLTQLGEVMVMVRNAI